MLIESLYDEVAQRVPATPQLIASAVNTALGRFLRDSTAWRVNAKFKTKPGKFEYDLSDLVEEGLICAVTRMNLQGDSNPIDPYTARDMDRRVPGWRTQSGEQPRAYIAPQEPHLVRLYPIPLRVDTVEVELALYCNPSTVNIPDWLGEMYRKELVEGAAGVLYRIPKKAWTDVAMSKDCDLLIDEAARSARARIDKSHTRAIVTLKSTPFDEL
ncbi:hypothetical protein [Variovorax sp. 278MFTsu5.1]|uniref:hypothetical protein n=1 Tax=Variovorax sp. 278MFTsu5.1 TaxID=3158366 RepID=UPI003AB0C452